MCKLTNNIKFCSCVAENVDIEELDNYWVLNRYNADKNEFTLGETMLPFDKFTSNYRGNERIIGVALAKKDSFDTPINFKEKDRLQIVLNNNSENSEAIMEFDYEYKSGVWVNLNEEEEELDPFYLANNFNEIDYGIIKDIEYSK